MSYILVLIALYVLSCVFKPSEYDDGYGNPIPESKPSITESGGPSSLPNNDAQTKTTQT
jgi:hypothetical protein